MGWTNTLATELRSYLAGNLDATGTTTRRRHPETHGEWVERYSWLHDAYVGNPYTVADMRVLGLFRAIDPNGQVIAETRRLTRDVQHVVDTGAQALAGSTMSLEVGADGDDATVGLGNQVWRRSGIKAQRMRWARWLCGLGDISLEVVRGRPTRPHESRIIAHDPRHVELEYDLETGTRLVRAIIRMPYTDAADVDPYGVATGADRVHTYVRILDAKQVTTYDDGKLDPAQSGPHGLGVVPLVHVSFAPFVDEAHGDWAAPGLESALALVDSLLTQILAIGNRFGNPILSVTGARLAADSDVLQFGRTISGLPVGASVSYVESSLTQITTLLEAAVAAREAVRQTLPEFLFVDAGANSSGTALSYRGAQFVAKYEEARERFYAAVATATQYAIDMDAGREYDDEREQITISGSPILPVDRAVEIGVLHDVLDKSGLTRTDYIRGLQRIGIVDAERDPADYLAEVEAERAVLREAETQSISTMLGTAPVTPQEPDTEEDGMKKMKGKMKGKGGHAEDGAGQAPIVADLE